MMHRNSLRRALTLLVLAAGATPLLGVILLLFLWLMPTLENQVAENNRAVATALAAQSERTLLPTQAALLALAPKVASYERQKHLQVALDTLIASSDLFEAIYYVGADDHIDALAIPATTRIQHADFIDLDLSGSPTLQLAKTRQQGVWSDALRSPISSESVVATAIPAGNGFLIGEISLKSLSGFVRRLSGENATLCILDRRGLVVAHPDQRLSAEQVNFSNLPVFEHGDSVKTARFRMEGVDVIGTLVPIRDLDWHVIVTQPLAVTQRPVLVITATLIVLAVLGAAVCGWLGFVVARRVADRFDDLATLSEHLAVGDYPQQWPQQTLTEAERLNEALRRMASAIQEREQALRELNLTLEHKVAERTATLKDAQATLARSEKLAALGSLVAGIAHELNTPIGNALMAASAFQHQNQLFAKTSREGLRRSMLDEHIESGAEASELMVRNLNRASELISSFKQVAIDQSTSQRRQFELAELVREIVTTLSPTLRKARCEVSIREQAEIELDSYPGPLGQVIINLINNAVVHGYNGQAGTITIAMRSLAGGRAELSIADSGQGISPLNLGRIFDPFFTTKLGQGGSGLGLSICHSIVFNLLGGEIRVENEEGGGTRFLLTLPISAPAGIPPDQALSAGT